MVLHTTCSHTNGGQAHSVVLANCRQVLSKSRTLLCTHTVQDGLSRWPPLADQSLYYRYTDIALCWLAKTSRLWFGQFSYTVNSHATRAQAPQMSSPGSGSYPSLADILYASPDVPLYASVP